MKINPLIEYISQFVELTNQDISILSKNLKYRKYLKGQYIEQQGDICKYETFIVKGCAKKFHIDNKGQKHIIKFSVESSLATDFESAWAADLESFFKQTPTDYNVKCLQDTEVIQYSLESLHLFFDEIPKFEHMYRVVVQDAYIASQKRILRNLSMPALERYEKFIELYPNIEQLVPQYMIASYLGITKQFLSKIKKEIS